MGQLLVATLNFLVHRIQLFIRGFQLLLRGLEFFIRTLQLLVARLNFLIRRLQLFVGCLLRFNNRLQVLLGGVQLLAEERHQQFEVDVADAVTVAADRLVLREAITNVVDNAIKYGPQRSTVLTVS